MIIVMQKQASGEAVQTVVQAIRQSGLMEHISHGQERTLIGAVGDERVLDTQRLSALPQVERVIRVLHEWKIISREVQAQDSVIKVRGVAFGGQDCVRVAYQQEDMQTADAWYLDPFFVSANPYVFQHKVNERESIAQLCSQIDKAHQMGKPVMVRVYNRQQIAEVLQYGGDILYLGGELMSNRTLLEEVGRLNTPVVLCKDKHHRFDEWLNAAEYIALQGNHQIILGEAGTLSFDAQNLNRLDIEAIVCVRQLTHLPVLANISCLWHHTMPQAVLYRLAQAAGVNAIIGAQQSN